MNPLVLHFLPSVIRGVFRFDDELQAVTDTQGYQQLVQTKLRFLPPHVAEHIRLRMNVAEDLQAGQGHQVMVFSAPGEVTQRAKTFFRGHPYFENAVDGNGLAKKKSLENADNFLEIQFVKKILAPLLTNEGLQIVHPQWEVGRYRVDFALLRGSRKLAIEIDGFGKFQNRGALDDFIRRQNLLAKEGWTVVRYTYGQVMERTDETLEDLYAILADDPKLIDYLAVGISRQSSLPGLQTSEKHLDLVRLVNDFHRAQDCFAYLMIRESQAADVIQIRDGFDLDYPFVALAISALFEFLDAIAGVVDIDFDLPEVSVFGPRTLRETVAPLHPRVSFSANGESLLLAFDSLTVRKGAYGPIPPCSGVNIQFRRNLSLDQIKSRLDYFAQNLFGYPSGTKKFQNSVLKRVFDGQDVLGIAATGSGKSFCFWLPALLRPGLTLIVAPLRSLMRDQRLTLLNYGIASAEFINSDVTAIMKRRIMEEAKLGYLRLLYISPERLRIKSFLDEIEQLKDFVPIHFLTIDEAHCISEWGHDFRPSYLKLPYVRGRLGSGGDTPQLIALTATAGNKVEADMKDILQLSHANVERADHQDREKFSYQVILANNSSMKSKIYHQILSEHLPTSLKKESLDALLEDRNKKDEKAIGLVFCIYADPHGKHSIWDGTAHYLCETMRALNDHNSGKNDKKHLDLDDFSNGRVRVFSSKPPTLCPNCFSYAYTSARNAAVEDEEEDDSEEESFQPNPLVRVAGRKICYHCKHEFDASNFAKPPDWNNSIKFNQDDFKKSEFDILVATKGFGMGIDKGSVRFVVHTSMPSGMESWYQEVGRAGRDNERAHVVLLCEPPHADCMKKLRDISIANTIKGRPDCNYRSGCRYGKENLCDYGKQHMFITRSYPGARSDAMGALRMLNKLMLSRQEADSEIGTISTSNQYISIHELALYRLMVLGIVVDYVVKYGKSTQFIVQFLLPPLADLEDIDLLVIEMDEKLECYRERFSGPDGKSVSHKAEILRQEYGSLERDAIKEFSIQNDMTFAFYCAVYDRLLVLLDHTYKDVLQMRYAMLLNLLGMAESKECRRRPIISYFERQLDEFYQCRMCDICAPDLDFADTRCPPIRSSDAEKEALLEKLLLEDSFDLPTLRSLANDFADYPTAKYWQALRFLEGDPNNLTALFMAREFSPPDERIGNSKRLLFTANQRNRSLADIQDLYGTSPPGAESDLLLLLNEADGSCDSPDGWRFLVMEAEKPEHRRSEAVRLMRESLEFFMFVEDEDLFSGEMQLLNDKAHQLESLFHA